MSVRAAPANASLLRLINRLDEPTSGTVFLEGQDTASPRARLRRRVGMVMRGLSVSRDGGGNVASGRGRMVRGLLG